MEFCATSGQLATNWKEEGAYISGSCFSIVSDEMKVLSVKVIDNLDHVLCEGHGLSRVGDCGLTTDHGRCSGPNRAGTEGLCGTRRSCPSLLRIILLLLLLVDLLLTLQDLLHELQRVARRLAIAEGILNLLGTRRLGRIVRLQL
jgi:hypothetical protein